MTADFKKYNAGSFFSFARLLGRIEKMKTPVKEIEKANKY